MESLDDELCFDDDEEERVAKPPKVVMTEEEKLEKRRLHFQKARRRAKLNKVQSFERKEYLEN
jgi:hypothetical protein